MATSRVSKVLILPAIAGLLLMTAGIASAHNPNASLSCNDGNPVLNISLTNYQASFTNTVSATIDGTSVLATTTFGTTYSHSFSAGSPFVAHTAQVIVLAGDDPTGSKGYSRTINLSSEACLAPTPTPKPTPTPTPVPTPTPTAVPTPTPTAVPTPTPTAVPTPTPTPVATQLAAPTPTPTGSALPTDSASAPPSGGVEAATATPRVTAPSTSTIDQGSSSGPGGSIGFVVALLGAIALVVAFTPIKRRGQQVGRNNRRD
jgi:hypothetical protein